MRNRAYSLIDIKSIDEDQRIFRGVATTPTVDRMGDIIDPLGVKFANPLPLLWQHKHDQPIGTVKFEKPTKEGIRFEGRMPFIKEPGPLKDRVDTAWLEVKYGLVRATSVGFRPIEYSFMDNGGINYAQSEVYELSTVTIPAQSEALIDEAKAMGDEAYMRAIKALDREVRHEEGVPDPEIPEIPSAPEPQPEGKKAVVVRLGKAAQDRAPFTIRRIHPAK